MRNRRTHPAAFTLLELVLVMALLVMIMGMAVPSLRNFGAGRKVTDNADQIVVLTHWARTQAVSRGLTYRLNYDRNRRSYYLSVDPGTGSFEPPYEEVGREFVLPDNIQFEWPDAQVGDDGGLYVTFWPSGRTDPSTISLSDIKDPNGHTVWVTCKSATETYRVVNQLGLPQQ